MNTINNSTETSNMEQEIIVIELPPGPSLHSTPFSGDEDAYYISDEKEREKLSDENNNWSQDGIPHDEMNKLHTEKQLHRNNRQSNLKHID